MSQMLRQACQETGKVTLGHFSPSMGVGRLGEANLTFATTRTNLILRFGVRSLFCLTPGLALSLTALGNVQRWEADRTSPALSSKTGKLSNSFDASALESLARFGGVLRNDAVLVK